VPTAQKLILNWPLTIYTPHELEDILNSKEVTLVLGITALIAALVGISYGVIANHITARNLTKLVEGTSDQVGLAIKECKGLCHPLPVWSWTTS
jgi:hypothetical protein